MKLLAIALVAPLLLNCSGGSSGGTAAGQAAVADGGPVDAAPGSTPPADTPQAALTVTAIENAKAGSSGWQLVNPAVNHEIEGYASLTSVNRGGDIDFLVNTSAATYNIEVYRMGYYGGAGARLLQSVANIARQDQPLPCLNPDNVIECDWNVSLRLHIPDAQTDPKSSEYWASGIYLARLSTNTTPVKDSYVIFVVRDDARAARYVQQLPVSTYQAYNFWGGKSLYTGCETHPNGWGCGPGQLPATAVSFNRPYGRGVNAASSPGVGAGEFLTNVQPARAGYMISNAGWDYNMLRWVEKQGYDTKYISNLDLHENSAVLQQAKAFVSAGHDEYYSKAMWDRLVQARAAGINLAFFSANQIYWQVRFVDGAYGATKKNRIMICYRGGGDPVTDNNLTTDQFRFLGRPEAGLVGNQYVTDPVVGDITISNAGHWLFAQTGATDGALLKGLLGYEVNSYMEGISPAQTKRLASSPFTFNGANMTSDVTYYVDQSTAQVFSTGSIQWSWGLDAYIPGNLRPDYTSPVAQAFTANLFAAIGEQNLATLAQPAAGLVLGIPAGDLSGAQVLANAAASSHSRINQWRLVASGDSDYYHVVARANGLCLQALATSAGAQAVTRDCSGADRQKWRFDAVDAGMVRLVEKAAGLCLQAPGAPGPGLTVEACGNKGSQHWVRTALN
ncbi:RICIN domain-containing protein [Noviherbaspirillum sedimenti]|uniref:RICIN domain-containing protein n=1 Tax=Noviherbaspirillum sedimenti TaxID=2320865 RepID=UPI001314DA5D|nr:RICIN domain-containing protein [Noviherbaspirillum sedimenti]